MDELELIKRFPAPPLADEARVERCGGALTTAIADERERRSVATKVARSLRPARSSTVAGRRRLPKATLAFAGALALAGGGAFAATQVLGPLHDVNATPDPTPLACAGLIGKPSTDAASYLAAHGYHAVWHFYDYSRAKALSEPNGTTPGAVQVPEQDFSGPPPGSVVSNVIATGPTSAVVETYSPNDPSAPSVGQPACGTQK